MAQEEEGKDASRRRRAQHLILSDVGWIAKDAHNARRGKEGPRERTKRGCGGTRGLTRRTAKEREFIIIVGELRCKSFGALESAIASENSDNRR